MKRIRRALIPRIYKCLHKNVSNKVSPVRSATSRATWRIDDLVDFGPDADEIELDSIATASPASSTTSRVTWWLRESANTETLHDSPAPELSAASATKGQLMDSDGLTSDNAETHLNASVSPAIVCSKKKPTGSGDGSVSTRNHQQSLPPQRTSDFCGGPENCGEMSAILESILQEMRELRQEYARLDVEIKTLNHTLKHEKVFVRLARCTHLQSCLGDLNEDDENDEVDPTTEAKHNEDKLEGIREESLPDASDVRGNSRTRIYAVDHRQHQEQTRFNEQLFTRTVKAAMIKCSLTISLIICLLFYKAAKLVLPFLRTDMRVLMTTSLFVAFFFLVM